MGATLWNPETAVGPASIWLPGIAEVAPASCTLEAGPVIAAEDVSTGATVYCLDNFTDTDGTLLSAHSPDQDFSGVGWNKNGPADLKILDGAAVNESVSTAGIYYTGIAANNVDQYCGMHFSFAAFSQEAITAHLKVTDSTDSANYIIFAIAVNETSGNLELICTVNTTDGGSAQSSAVEIPYCTWVNVDFLLAFSEGTVEANMQVITAAETLLPPENFASIASSLFEIDFPEFELSINNAEANGFRFNNVFLEAPGGV